jgi:hypothetical protein
MIKPKHGGARKGAGRTQKSEGERTYPYNVTLDLDSASILAELGTIDGKENLSRGIRLAAQLVKEKARG